MKYVKLILTLLLFSGALIGFAQKQEAGIYFKDGTELTGLIRLTKNDEIKYFSSEKSKFVKYLNKDIKHVKIYEEKNVKHLFSVQIVNGGGNKLLEKIVKGKVTLYKKVLRNYGLGNNHTRGMVFNDDIYNKYYVKKENENEATIIGIDAINIKKAKKYFSDCKIFLNKLKDRKFKKQNISKIIEFYNKECLN